MSHLVLRLVVGLRVPYERFHNSFCSHFLWRVLSHPPHTTNGHVKIGVLHFIIQCLVKFSRALLIQLSVTLSSLIRSTALIFKAGSHFPTSPFDKSNTSTRFNNIPLSAWTKKFCLPNGRYSSTRLGHWQWTSLCTHDTTHQLSTWLPIMPVLSWINFWYNDQYTFTWKWTQIFAKHKQRRYTHTLVYITKSRASEDIFPL